MKDTKTVVIVGVLIAVIAMSVAYAAFASNLTVTGKANITGDWDVKITSIEKTGGSGTEVGKSPTFTDTTASFDVNLEKPGDYAEYTVTVANNGSIDATLASTLAFKALTENTTASDGTKGTEAAGTGAVKFTIESQPATTLAKKSGTTATTTTFKVRATYDASVTTAAAYTSKTAEIDLTYQQKA